MAILKPAFFFLMAYFLGSIPFGVLIARMYRVDIRQVGSKNPGATNVLRAVGKKPAIFTLLGDLGKGMAASILGKVFLSSSGLAAIMGFMAIIGHDWSIFSRFRGGKGVATSLGVFLILAPLPAVLALLTWLGVFAVSRYVSLASVSAAMVLPVFIFLFSGGNSTLFQVALLASALLIFKHRSNIQRLMAGTEHGFRSKKSR
ncbi:MAG: glycerol-3-phosphate 1-O-acyltransferase PlsY [bacterium]